MMSVVEIFRYVMKNMFEKKGRVFLTIAGIVIGIFTFTFFMMASQGLSNAITEQFSAFGLNVLGVQSIENEQNGPPGGGGLDDTDLNKIKQVVSDYKYIAPGIAYTGQYEYGREKTQILAIAYPDEYWEDIRSDLGTEIEYGRDLRTGDINVVVLGAKTAREAFGKDHPIPLGSSIKVNGKSLRVIGIFKERGDLFIDSSMITSFDTIKDISGQDTYTLIRISFYDTADLDFMQKAIEDKLNPRNKEKKVNVTSPKQAIKQFEQILGVLQLIIGFVSSIALLVGGINVMNTMYSNILERINEISVMKALGARNQDIRNIFLLESSILGFIGAFIGFMLAYLLAEILSYLITNFAGYNVPVYFSIPFFLAVVIITSLLAMLFGTYPAIRAARVNPADNLRDE